MEISNIGTIILTTEQALRGFPCDNNDCQLLRGDTNLKHEFTVNSEVRYDDGTFGYINSYVLSVMF